jgi:lipoate-protein ligase A
MELKLCDQNYKQCMVKSLFFLTHTRLDIVYTISCVSKYMFVPQYAHLQVVKCIFRYLKGTSNNDIFFPTIVDTIVIGYVDANWA